MQQKRDLAIVLRAVAYEERHRIVTALTEQHGQVSAMAKNAIQSRRFGGCLEPFTASEWLFSEKPDAELLQLQEAHIRRPFEGLRKDFERLSLASAFNEVMLRVAPKYEPCPDLFRMHSNALAALEESADRGHDLALLNAYLAKALQWHGSQPQLAACAGCSAPIETMEADAALSCIVDDATWVCPGCRSSATRHVQSPRGGAGFHHALLRVTPAAIQDFHMALQLPIRQAPSAAKASRREHQELFKFLEALFVFHMPGFDRQPLKSLRFLELESSVQPQAANPR